MKQLFFDNIVIESEKKHNWKQAIEFLYKQWKSKPFELNNLICVGTEIWISLLLEEYNELNPFPLKNEEFLSKDISYAWLIEVSNFGFDNFFDNALFNSFFGYMIKVTPYFFGDYVEWRKKGIGMISHAYDISPDDLVVKAIFFETFSDESPEKYNEICQKLWEEMSPQLWGESAVQKHFFYVLQGDVFAKKEKL